MTQGCRAEVSRPDEDNKRRRFVTNPGVFLGVIVEESRMVGSSTFSSISKVHASNTWDLEKHGDGAQDKLQDFEESYQIEGR